MMQLDALNEITIAEIHRRYRDGSLTAVQLVQWYLDRIEALDRAGPKINAIISLNPDILSQARACDEALKRSGKLSGPMHGIPVLIKDQGDVLGLPTTMGSVLFKDFQPQRDAFAIARLRAAGALFLGKTTLGECGAGDTHGSLFGSTSNVYDTTRTAGGSSGGSGAAISANFAAVSLGQEGFSSIRRPAAWNGIVGMRPSAGLVSRSGVFGGWPAVNGSLGPMTRMVEDAARVLHCLVGFDAADPVTARGVGQFDLPDPTQLNRDALKGARIGVLRQSMGSGSEPDSADFAKVGAVFDAAIDELRAAGAVVIDPVQIEDLNRLLALRSNSLAEEEGAFAHYLAGVKNPPFTDRKQAIADPRFAQTFQGVKTRWLKNPTESAHYASMKAREQLLTNLLKTMAEHQLDAIVHKAVEHQPTRIADGIAPPYVDQKGASHLNTFVLWVPSIVVPAGFTSDALPAGITFLGRPYDDARMLHLAYAYEQHTQHRRAPALQSAKAG
jgi:Asp-tRNA(Asn)/Glu-tRNA(Gln) amidotransferase A subunit family amidase